MSGAVEAGTSKVARLVDSSELEMDYQEPGKRRPLTTSTSVRMRVPEIKSVPKWLPCMNACMCAVFHCICICMCSLYSN